MKLWGGRFRSGEDPLMEDFNTSFPFDKRMYRQDITGSRAHVRMLGHCGIIPQEDADQIDQELEQILKDIEEGRLLLEGSYEDIHTFVESVLTERLGDLGKKLHTARSRNDQVALDTRMYAREQTEQLLIEIDELIHALKQKGDQYPGCIMPGYTHLQRAQTVTFSYYLGAYASMFGRDKKRLLNALNLMDESPLGCCALAGTTHAINREETAGVLGFSKPADNFLDGVSDRDFLLELSSDLSIMMMHLSRLSEELILWSSQEFSFVSIDDAYSTGSSIMPQKKNPDACELIRGKTGRVYGDMTALFTMMKGLPLAYNKDMQEDKTPFFDACDTAHACLQMAACVIATLTVHTDTMRQSVKKGFLNATEVADYLVGKGVSFRDAHAIVGSIVIACEDRGCGVEDLPIDELKRYSDVFDEDVYAYIDAEHVLEKGIKKEMI